MTPRGGGEFTKDTRPRLRDPRRKRWSETYGLFLASLGGAVEVLALILDRLASSDVVTVLPPAWRPYIVGASAALGVVAFSEKRERRRDYLRYLEREQRRAEQQHSPPPPRLYTPPPRSD